MPYKANEARRPPVPTWRHRAAHRPAYDAAHPLARRGPGCGRRGGAPARGAAGAPPRPAGLTGWATPEALAAWHPPKTGRRGRSRTYSDLAIETGHLPRLVFGRPWRQTEGLLRSLATLLGLDIGVPDPHHPLPPPPRPGARPLPGAGPPGR